MRGKILLITVLAAMNSFLIFFAIGFNSKHALVEDPSLPPIDMAQVRKSIEEREAKPSNTSVSKTKVNTEPAVVTPREAKSKSGKNAKKSGTKSKHK